MSALRGCTCARTARRWGDDGVCAGCGQRVLESQLTPVLLAVLCGGTGMHLERNTIGYDEKRRIRYGLAEGSGDFVGFYRGRYLEVEMKTPTGKLSPAQRARRDMLDRLGCVYAVVRSEADARALLERLGRATSGPQPAGHDPEAILRDVSTTGAAGDTMTK